LYKKGNQKSKRWTRKEIGEDFNTNQKKLVGRAIKFAEAN
jgi:hypothetical protein